MWGERWGRRAECRQTFSSYADYGGGGGSRSTRSLELSNNLHKLKRSIGEIRENAWVQVQNRYTARQIGVSHSPRRTRCSRGSWWSYGLARDLR
jgi:hypothetical protein